MAGDACERFTNTLESRDWQIELAPDPGRRRLHRLPPGRRLPRSTVR